MNGWKWTKYETMDEIWQGWRILFNYDTKNKSKAKTWTGHVLKDEKMYDWDMHGLGLCLGTT